MNRLALAAAVAFTFVLSCSLQARPLYPPLFMEEYKANGPVVAAAKGAKCDICHEAAAKSKKERNEYGKALNKHLTAADFKNLNANRPALAIKVSAALKATEMEKNSEGKPFGEIIKSGKLPAK